MTTDEVDVKRLAIDSAAAFTKAEEQHNSGACAIEAELRGEERARAEGAIAEAIWRFYLCPKEARRWIRPGRADGVLLDCGTFKLLVPAPAPKSKKWESPGFWLADPDSPDYREWGGPITDLADLGTQLGQTETYLERVAASA